MVLLWASHRTVFTGRAVPVEGPPCPQLHGCLAAATDRLLGLGSLPYGHSLGSQGSSPRNERLPGPHKAFLQTSQSMTSPQSSRKSEKQACPDSRDGEGGGWGRNAVVFIGHRTDGRGFQHL